MSDFCYDNNLIIIIITTLKLKLCSENDYDYIAVFAILNTTCFVTVKLVENQHVMDLFVIVFCVKLKTSASLNK